MQAFMGLEDMHRVWHILRLWDDFFIVVQLFLEVGRFMAIADWTSSVRIHILTFIHFFEMKGKIMIRLRDMALLSVEVRMSPG